VACAIRSRIVKQLQLTTNTTRTQTHIYAPTDTNLHHLHSQSLPYTTQQSLFPRHFLHHGSLQQQRYRTPQFPHLPPLNPDPGGRSVAEQAGHHRVRAVAGEAGDRARRFSDDRLSSRPHRRVLSRVVAPLALPARDVLAHRSSLRLHHLRLRCHKQGRW